MGSGHILIRSVKCFSGFEDNITACSYFNVTIPPSHDQDVGVKCKQGQCCLWKPVGAIHCNCYQLAEFKHYISLYILSGNEAREGEIRLNRTYGNNNAWEGRVEIFLGGEWGTVCHISAYSEDARVVCRQLGYNNNNNNSNGSHSIRAIDHAPR